MERRVKIITSALHKNLMKTGLHPSKAAKRKPLLLPSTFQEPSINSGN